jgi:hypothetical protein
MKKWHDLMVLSEKIHVDDFKCMNKSDKNEDPETSVQNNHMVLTRMLA